MPVRAPHKRDMNGTGRRDIGDEGRLATQEWQLLRPPDGRPNQLRCTDLALHHDPARVDVRVHVAGSTP